MLKYAIVVCFAAIVSAEAEAEADPYLAYGYGPAYGLRTYGLSHYGYGGYLGYASPYYAGYANAGRYYANSGGAVHIAKREAEAEPEAEAEADPYYAYGYGLAGYGYAAHPYAYS